MDVLAYTTGFNTLVWMNTDVLRLINRGVPIEIF